MDNLVCVPDNHAIRLELLHTFHDSPVGGHWGQAKTCELISRQYTWTSMRKYVNRYIANCPTCIRAKLPRQEPQGHLLPLAIPESPCSSISIDFIVSLPPSTNGVTAIWVVVDRLTKMAHFIPCQETITAEGLAQLFFSILVVTLSTP